MDFAFFYYLNLIGLPLKALNQQGFGVSIFVVTI